jgi:hypothetical protein
VVETSTLGIAQRRTVDADGVALVTQAAEQRLDERLVAQEVRPPEIPANEAPVIGGGALAPQGLEFGGSAVVNWDYQIRNKGVALGLGDHTAVLLRGWSSSTNVVLTAASCNHGACAGASSMNTHCTMSGFRTDDGTHTRYFYSEPSGSTSQVSGGCSTEYGWDSGKNQHNCNDDAELQRDAIYNDSWQSTTAGPCSTRGFHNWSPGCH